MLAYYSKDERQTVNLLASAWLGALPRVSTIPEGSAVVAYLFWEQVVQGSNPCPQTTNGSSVTVAQRSPKPLVKVQILTPVPHGGVENWYIAST